jgi:RNA polymerase sigma-70 factor, ECF subfamily
MRPPPSRRPDTGHPDPSSEPGDVVERVRAGDERAFEALFRAHYAALCGFAVRYVRTRALAEELVQDLFMALWARRASWEVRGGSGSVRAYLFAAVRNRALNARTRRAVERDWEEDETAAEVRTLHHAPVAADAALEAAELHGRLTAAIESLPERCRLVMQLRWRDQLSYAEIAEVMGISTKGVENQLSRGLKALRDRLTRE